MNTSQAYSSSVSLLQRYFSTLGPSSYELGSPDYESNIIIDCFGKERLNEYKSKHKLDLLLVYAASPQVVEQAPGGRDNAKMVSKILFETFAAPSPEDGSYYLRPDRIRAAILLDGTSGLPSEREAAIDALNTEKANDQTVRMKLQKIENELRCNVRNNYGAVTDDDIIDTRTQGAGNEGKQRLVAQKKKR